jgi:hypothetical protein
MAAVRLLTMILVAAFVTPSFAHANATSKWVPVAGTRSATLASSGWELAGSTGITFHNQTQAVVTFWRFGAMPNESRVRRCVDYFDSLFRPIGGYCAEPHKDAP